MSGSEHARPVWLTREQRDDLIAVTATLYGGGFRSSGSLVQEIVAAWDAAPADPAEAVRIAVAAHWMPTGMGQEERIDEVYDPEGAAIYRSNLVLRALGHPKEPT